MNKVRVNGNIALAEAACRAGCRFYAGFPIAPQTEIAAFMAAQMPAVNGSYVQSESDIASIHMCIGAGSGGTRCLTTASSCGVALQAEGISVACGMRVPVVIGSIMRRGSGAGDETVAQTDYFQATKAAGNGGIHPFVFAPASAQEVADITAPAFDIADRYRYPVIILMDSEVATAKEDVAFPERLTDAEVAEVFEGKSAWRVDGKKENAERHAIHLTLREPEYKKMQKAFEEWEAELARVEEYRTEDAEIVLTAYGVCGNAARDAVDALRDDGIKAGLIRPITVFPFPHKSYERLNYSRVKAVLALELANPGQFAEDVRTAVCGKCPVVELHGANGAITVETIEQAAKTL